MYCIYNRNTYILSFHFQRNNLIYLYLTSHSFFHLRYHNLIILNQFFHLRYIVIRSIQIFLYRHIHQTNLLFCIFLLLFQHIQLFLHIHMPQLIIPILFLSLNCSLFTGTKPINLMLPVINLLHFLFLFTSIIQQIRKVSDIIIHQHQILILQLMKPFQILCVLYCIDFKPVLLHHTKSVHLGIVFLLKF